jgi:hypothetical protein
MNIRTSLILAVILVSAIPLSANDKKKKDVERGMLEKMEAVPCGAKQRGLAGLGSFWASAGITHVNSDEKLCPQYLLRTDEMNYEIRPMNLKHATILPVGHEGVFTIKENSMLLTVEDAGDRKTRSYEVVSMNPINPVSDPQKTSASQDEDRSHASDTVSNPDHQ